MNYDISPPSDELKDIVKQYVVFNSFEDIDNMLFLPDGGNFLIFNRNLRANSKLFGDDKLFPIPQNYSFNFKTNRVKHIFLDLDYKHDDESLPIIMVELLPMGFYKLFNMDMSLSDFKYEEISKELVDKYFSKLYSNGSIEEELKYLDNSLIELNRSQNNSHLIIEDVVDRIYNDYHLEVTVEDLLEEFGYSRSTMERQFKKTIGLTPKNFIFISKFCNTLLEYVHDKLTFHEIQYIYSDNSHMNSVFKKFLGIAPSEMMLKVANEELYIYQLQNLKLNKYNSNQGEKVITPLDILKYSKCVNVLYVEDNEVMRKVMSNLLKNYFENLDIAKDGQEALDMYLKTYDSNVSYDLIITDVNMPKMDGIEMSREIFKIMPSQIIIIISAHVNNTAQVKELGVRAVLTKPVDYNEFSKHIFEISKEIHDKRLI